MLKAKTTLCSLAAISMLALAGCSASITVGGNPEPGPGADPEPGAEFTVSSLAPEAFLLEPGLATVVDSSTLNLSLGGSGSCPPAIAEVVGAESTVDLILEATDPNQMCTLDFVPYGFEIKSQSYDFETLEQLTVLDADGELLQTLEIQD